LPTQATMVPTVAPSRRRAAFLLAALFTFFFSAYILTSSADYFSTGDTTIRIQQAENIIGHLNPCLEGWQLQYPHHLKKEYFDPRIHHGHNAREVCSTYLLGQPLTIVPFDLLGSRLAVHLHWPYGPAVLWFDRLVGPLLGAIEVLIFFLFAIRLGYGIRRSLLLTLVLGFATTVWPDEQSVLEHTEVALFLLLAMYGGFRFRDQGAGWKFLVLAGVGIGGAAITRYQDAFLGAVGLGVYLVLPGGPWPGLLGRVKRGLFVGVGLLPFIVLDMWYSWARFGSVFASGHEETVFGYAIWKGALGLILSPGKGILWYCPVLFLLILAGPRFARRLPALSAGIAATAMGFVLLYGYVTYWHGDPAWGPRYLYGMLPMLILPLGELFQWKGKRRRIVWAVTAVVVSVSFVFQLSAVSVSPWRTWYRVISYEESRGHKWQWIAARYQYHWDIHESPLNFQVHGLYQLAYDSFLNSSKYELVPPNEDPILDKMTVDFAINQWNFWWASNEFNWWMGQDKIIAGVIMLLAVMLASGTLLAGEVAGVFWEPRIRRRPDLISEAA
jgi:hypothetical protein